VKLALVTDFYYPWIAGPSAAVRNLAHGLANRGHVVTILAPSPTGRSFREWDGPVEITRVETVPAPFGHNLRFAPFPCNAASLWLDEKQPEVVNIHHPFPLSAAALFAARRRHIPVLATNHTIPECALWGVRDMPRIYRGAEAGFSAWLRFLLSCCVLTATPTLTAAEALRSLGHHGTVVPVSNGVDTQRFRPGPPDESLRRQLDLDSRPVVLYTGRLDAEKQMDVWLQTAARLIQTVDARFLVGGLGTSRRSLEVLAQTLGLEDRMTFMGYVDEDQLPAVYRLADVYFITSPVELQSISTLEAVASGLPVVAVRAGALPELVRDGENGYLVERGQPEEASAALAQILTDKGRRGAFASASRTISLQHDLGASVSAYEELFERVASRERGYQQLERAPAPGH
jgi:glycosyltransferase involved in cell wall biosynthesis